MFKFLVGMAAGWTAARTIDPKIESPWKPPTYEECIVLGHKAKKAFEHITEKLEEAAKEEESSTKYK